MRHLSTMSLAPAAILADLISEEFLREFADEVGVEVGTLELTESGTRQRAYMQWSFNTDRSGIPELARRFLPAQVRLNWDQQWGPIQGGAASGDLSVVLVGRPAATVTGTSVLQPGGAPAGAGSTLITDTRTEADLPFPVASQVERLIDRDLAGWILKVQARVLARRADGVRPPQ